MHSLIRKLRASVRSALSADAPHRDATRPSDADGGTESELPRSDLTEAEFLVEQGITRDDYLIDLLRRRGGRLSQTEVSEVVGWSPSTTSRRLSELEEAGVIRRYRISRGNVVVLSEFAPGAPTASGDD